MANTVLTNYYELISPEQPGSASFATNGSEATLEFIVPYEKMSAFLSEIFGTVVINANGYLNRTLPLSHPTYSYLYASGITSVQGLGQDGVIKADLFPNVNLMGNTDYRTMHVQAVYAKYKLTIRFETRPYLLLSDRQIQELQNWGANFSYAKRTTTGVANDSYNEYFEWLRYVSVKVNPAVQLLTANRGNYYFRSSGAPAGENAPVDFKPISAQNSGNIYLTQSSNSVIVTWYFVPLKMSKSSTIRDALNKVNFGFDYKDTGYNPALYGYNFLGYPAGSLLFKKYTVKPYSPSYPLQPLLSTDAYVSIESNNNNQLCDIEFEFIERQIPDDQIGSLPDKNLFPNNGYGYIYYGHNLVPYPQNKKYYFITTGKSPDARYPIYWSHPMQRLMQYRI